MVVELYLVVYDPARVLQGLEAVAMRALLLEGAYHALDHAVLPQTMWHDERLASPLTAY